MNLNNSNYDVPVTDGAYYQDDFTDNIFADNPDDRCPVVCLLDVSGSMNYKKNIGKLNDAIKRFFDDLNNDPLAKRRIDLAIVGCGGSKPQLLQPMTTVQDIDSQNFPELFASGGTPMDACTNMSLDLVEERKSVLRQNKICYYRPLIVVITDGGFNISEATKERLYNSEQSKQHRVIAIGIGDGAHKPSLQQLSKESPPCKLDDNGFSEFFLFLSSSMQDIVTDAKPGESVQVEMPKCLTLM